MAGSPTRHPLLSIVLSRIIKDESRHFSFYFNQARFRLRPHAAQMLTSLIVRNFWMLRVLDTFSKRKPQRVGRSS
jgi:hypothetical protein